MHGDEWDSWNWFFEIYVVFKVNIKLCSEYGAYLKILDS